MLVRGRTVALVTLLALMALASLSEAGGDAIRATIRDFERRGAYGATFTVVASDDRRYFTTVADLDAEHVVVHQCRTLRVVAEYPSLKWWWHRYLNGHATRSVQANALDVLQAAALRGDNVGFGYIGTGWSDPLQGQPCTVISHALEEVRENPIEGTMTAVLSYYKVP
jgi:hypothetical protein